MRRGTWLAGRPVSDLAGPALMDITTPAVPAPETDEERLRRVVREEVHRSLVRVEADLAEAMPKTPGAHVHRIVYGVLRAMLYREITQLTQETTIKEGNTHGR